MLLQIQKKPCKHPCQNHLFEWGTPNSNKQGNQLRFLMQRLKSQIGMHCPPPPDSLMKNSTKLLSVEDQTAPPPRVDPDEEYKDREQKLPSPIQTTPPSETTREKYTKQLKELVKKRRLVHQTGNKYDLPRAIHRYNTRAHGTQVYPMEQHVTELATNLQGYHQANFFIDPTTGSSLEYRHILKGPTKYIWENSFANEI